jgi:hypothetical protein
MIGELGLCWFPLHPVAQLDEDLIQIKGAI